MHNPVLQWGQSMGALVPSCCPQHHWRAPASPVPQTWAWYKPFLATEMKMGELGGLLSKEDGLETRLGLAAAAPSRLSFDALSGAFPPTTPLRKDISVSHAIKQPVSGLS